MRLPDSLRWKAGRTIGQGGQAPVMEVTDKTGDFAGKYALKALSQGRPKQAYERFAREIKVIKKLDHPRIIKVFDNSEPDDTFQFYVMEYIEGAKPLSKLLGTPANPFEGDPVMAVEFFKQLVHAIGAWGKEDIVHRDLSPANILVLPNNDIKIIDFGICYEDDGKVLTLVDEGVGTRDYTAPECESGGGGPVTIAADLYSAGKVLWAAVTNQRVFAREKPVFNDKAMPNLFPDPRLWHLHHIFAGTIRHNLADRFGNAPLALNIATRVQRLLSFGNLPLVRLAEVKMCPVCGWGELMQFQGPYSHRPGTVIAGKANSPTIQDVRCTYCGFCFAIDMAVLKASYDKINSLN